jgi:methyl-accepting chemotaxis protein
MTLRTLFAIPIAIILIVTVSLAGMVAGQGWSGLSRGRVAIEAVEHMRLLLALQTQLRAERVVTNIVLGKANGLPEPMRRRFDTARQETDAALQSAVTEVAGSAPQNQFLGEVNLRLSEVRGMIDQLLARDLSGRTLAELADVMPGMLAVSQLIDGPLERAKLAVTAADESLSGLLTEDRLAESLRDQVGLIAAALLPRFNKAERPSAAELSQVHILLARAAYLTQLLNDTVEIAGATEDIRRSLADLRAIDIPRILGRLEAGGTLQREDDTGALLPQQLLIPWGKRINQLRAALIDATVAHVTARQTSREREFKLVMAGFGVVVVAVLESVVLLSQFVVGPLAQLGLAITRIAAGDRSTPLTLQSSTREINDMAMAVETLREAASVADATALRHRLAARQRLEMLHEALGIVRTVEGPARALERGVASLSDGIDATIALITTPKTAPPPTLEVAADAVRASLAEIRSSAAELNATLAAAAEAEDRPEAECVAHILAVRAQVDRREAAVRRFVLPSLVALRDTAATAGETPGPALRNLVSDQFARIEETVAVISAMLATVTRASAIVRDLPLEEDAAMAA